MNKDVSLEQLVLKILELVEQKRLTPQQGKEYMSSISSLYDSKKESDY